MKHSARVALAFASLCFFTSAACGQTSIAVAQQQPAPSAGRQISCTMTLGPNLGMAAPGPTAPYSAVEESSTVETLADGTHISGKPTSEKIYRDSQGRIRTERPFCHGIADTRDATVIQIQDPVSGYAYILDEQNHVAHRYALEVRKPTIRPATTAEADPAAAGLKSAGSPPKLCEAKHDHGAPRGTDHGRRSRRGQENDHDHPGRIAGQ